MRATSRRCRIFDPLTSPGVVHRPYQSLRDQLLALIPPSEKELRRLLEAVRHLDAAPQLNSRRGRPARFPREDLLQVAGPCASSVSVKRGRISPANFVGQYLLVIDFPADVHHALASGLVKL